MSAAMKWAPNVIRLLDAFAGECRVCHLPIEQGTKAWRFTWKEERGQGHESCGFYTMNDDTDLDRKAVACMREFEALKPGQAVPKHLSSKARELGLVRRIEAIDFRADNIVQPTPLGFALMKLIRGSR